MIELRLFDGSGTVDAFAPDWQGLNFTDLFSNEGTVQMEYPKTGLNYSRLITPNCEGALFLDNVEIDGSRFRTSELSGDDVKSEAVTTIQGITWVSRLKEIVVYPPNWPVTNPKEYTFSTATAGQIMRTLLLAGQARSVNAATQTTWTFTNTIDSAGAGWTKQATISFNPGTTLWDVLKSLVGLGMCDFVTKGRQLYMVNPGTLGVDRTVTATPVILRRGRDFSDAPVNSSARELLTTVLVEGDQGVFQEVNDSAAVTAWGRREGFLSQTGIPDTGTLTVAGQTYIDLRDHLREERAHELTFDPTGPLPFTNYKASDYVFTDVSGTPTKYLVLQIRLSWDANGRLTGGVTLNDRFDEWDVKLQQRLDGFNGVTVSQTPIDQIDTTTPSAPGGLSLSSAWFADGTGEGRAQISASWAAVTTNTDGSVITDLSHYEVGYKESTWSEYRILTSSNTSLTWSPVVPGLTYNVRVRAVDKNDNESAWSSTSNIVGASDSTPPSQPSTPVVTNYLGVLRIEWDGKDSLGGAMPIDFKHTEVHLSTVTGFTPSASTLIDALLTAGRSVASGLVYGTTYYAKLIAVDKSGNKSTASAQGSGTPQQVVQTDIGGNVIGLEHIQFQDATNYIPDGSFEMATRRAAIATKTGGSGSWSFVNSGAAHGDWALSSNGAVAPGTYRSLYLMPANNFGDIEMEVVPSKPLYLRYAYKGTVGATGNANLVVRTTNSDASNSWMTLAGSTADGTWRVVDGQITLPANAKTVTAYLELPVSVTTGTWTFDRVEIREVVQSQIIQDLAVTTAKIANLAVNDAKIGSVAAGKITTGSLVADVTVGARIMTASSGARVELNTAGIQAFNGSGTQTVSVSASTGAVSIIGEFKTGTSGQRIIMNPVGASNPRIEFWPTGASAPSTMAVGSGGAGNYLAIESDWNGSRRTLLSVQPDFISMRVLDSSTDPNNNGGGHIDIHRDTVYMGWRNSSIYDNYLYLDLGSSKSYGQWSHGGASNDGMKFYWLSVGAGTGFSVSYSSTLPQVMRLWGQLFSYNATVWVNSSTTTGFSYSYSAGVGGHTFTSFHAQQY